MSKTEPIALAEIKFNELDNWLGIMQLDPPKTFSEKRVMYERLMEILELMFEPSDGKGTNSSRRINRRLILRDMRKIIDR
jgi:hypothetical protein